MSVLFSMWDVIFGMWSAIDWLVWQSLLYCEIGDSILTHLCHFPQMT